jgi:hypothetical protein
MKAHLTLASLAFLSTFVSIPWAGMLFLGDLTSNFTLGPQKAFILHAFHHFHEASTSI